MIRAIRRLAKNISFAVPVIVPVIVLVLWGLSYVRVLGLSNTLVRGSRVRGESGIWSTGGRVLLDTVRHTDVSRIPGWRGWTVSFDPYANVPQWVDQPSVTRWNLAGFRGSQSLTPGGDGTTSEWAAMTVPYWAIAALATLAPAVVAGPAAFRRRRSGQRRCGACGYDLRATPDRCPECGQQLLSASDEQNG